MNFIFIEIRVNFFWNFSKIIVILMIFVSKKTLVRDASGTDAMNSAMVGIFIRRKNMIDEFTIFLLDLDLKNDDHEIKILNSR